MSINPAGSQKVPDTGDATALTPAKVAKLIYYTVVVVGGFGLLALLILLVVALCRPIDWPGAAVVLGLIALLLGVLRVLVRLWEMVSD